MWFPGRRATALVPLLFLSWSEARALPPPFVDAGGNRVVPICGTTTEHRAAHGSKNAVDACVMLGGCDDPSVRDAAPTSGMTVRIVVHVVNDADGTPPNGVTQAVVDAAIGELRADYAPYGVDFDLVATRFHDDADFYCLPNVCGPQFAGALSALKDRYAESPSTQQNIFVACQNACGYILLGMGTFPWDAEALGNQGGIFMNANYFGAGEKTLTHEMGHNLGLWHTQHGVSEVGSCADACRENVHGSDDPAADLVGDFCKDTPATPTNTSCSDPAGTDCAGVPWAPTDFGNYMGYGPDACVDHLTTDQRSRVHCWVRDRLSGQLVGSAVSVDAAGGVPPGSFGIREVRPNPFNPRVAVGFSAPEGVPSSIGVYDASGRFVRSLLDGSFGVAGEQEVIWDGRDDGGRDVRSGVYFFRLTAGSASETRKAVLLR